MVPIIALIGAGLDSLREGHRDVVASEIVSLISSELSLTDWDKTDNLENMNGEVKSFTRDGTATDKAGDAVYAAKIYVQGASADAIDPGQDYARRVELRLTSVPASVGSRFDDRKYYRRYSILVARLDK